MSIFTPFKNEALTDFSVPANEAAFQQGIALVRSQLGQKYPLYIAGNEGWTGETFDSINPARPAEVIGTFAKARKEHAERAALAAAAAVETWPMTRPEER